MSQRRRHAEDFTDSLSSFRSSSVSDVESVTLYSHGSMSQDSLDETTRINRKPHGALRDNNHSTILAGSSIKNSHTPSLLNTSTSLVTSMEPVPDLNKCIDLFQSELLQEQSQCTISSAHSDIKSDDNKENNNPQCAMTDKESKNEASATITNKLKSVSFKKETIHSHNITNESSKRDTNYNIHHKFGTITTPEKNVSKSRTASQPISLPVDTNKETQTDIQDERDSLNGHQEKFESILCFLDNQYNRIKEVSEPRQIIRRLSGKYIDSPKNFTEKLLTIIEESVINNEENSLGPSAIDLSRLTTEFRKMCKFIEDEAPPEWPPSPLSPACTEQILPNSESNKPLNGSIRKNEKSPSLPLNVAPLSITPLSGAAVVKRRLFQKLTKTNYNGSIDNLNNLSANISSVESFENLEAQCKRLFPEDQEYSHPLRKSVSVPSLLSMSQIQNICEKQMASLNDSTIDVSHQDKTIVNSPTLLGKSLYQSPLAKSTSKLKFTYAKPELETPDCKKSDKREKVSYSKTKSMKINKHSESNKPNKKGTYDYMTYDPDELEKTLLQDIAEKRKRCLDTARLITEINGDPVTAELQKSLGTSFMSSNDGDTDSVTHDEVQFLKTLTSCKNYQTYLEKQKPFFNLLCKPNTFNTPKSASTVNRGIDFKCKENKKEISSTKKTECIRSNILTSKPYNRNKLPLPGKRDGNNKETTENVKPKFFFTPGKSPHNENYKQKKLYFPSPGEKSQNILKSPHAEGLYRLNYNTIISPVGMYIRGTDMQLIKNVRAKTDDMLLSPAKKNVKRTPNSNLKPPTPSIGVSKTQRKTPLRINLSPRVETNRPYKYEVTTPKAAAVSSTSKGYFVLPKVSYKLPLQVKTIKETKPTKPGTRVEKLLETAENRIIIRHEGRITSTRNKGATGTRDHEMVEINYDPEDISIHIEQAASKTNFLHKQKKFN